MPLISFPNNGLVNAGPAGQELNKGVTQSLPLFDAGTQTKKNELLIKMLNNLAGKDINEIQEYCIKSLKMISCIVKAGGNIGIASHSIIRELTKQIPNLHRDDADFFWRLLILFTNRNTCTTQNINRTAAKYVEVLRQALQTINEDSFSKRLSEEEQKNLNIIKKESKKWYRGSYIGDVKVSITEDKLNIQLGRQNGTMGSVHKLELDMKLVEKIVKVDSSKKIQIDYKLLCTNYFEHNTGIKKISVKSCVLDSVLKAIKNLDLGGKNDDYCQDIVIKCLIQHITQTINNNVNDLYLH